MRIDSITPEQVGRFGEWAKKWIEIGLSTEPADFDKANAAALKAYELCGLNKPMVVLRMGSPYGATVGGALAWLMLKEGKLTQAQVRDQVGAQVGAQVGDQVGDQVRAQVGAQVWAQVGDQVGAQVRDQVWAQVGDQVRAQVGAQVWAQVRDQVGGAAHDGRDNDYGGQLFAGFSAYVTFIRDVLGWENPILKKFSVHEDLAKSCGWVWWHQNVLAISDRPCALHRDDRGRLHCENGPAIAYRDGWKLHYIHGVSVPEYVVERPEEITVQDIEKEENAEVRRVKIDRIPGGQARYLQESGAKEIHRDDWGVLYRKDLEGDEPLCMVKVVNSTAEPDGTFKDYFLRVHPECRPLLADNKVGEPQNLTALNAVASTFGKTGREYAPAIQT